MVSKTKNKIQWLPGFYGGRKWTKGFLCTRTLFFVPLWTYGMDNAESKFWCKPYLQDESVPKSTQFLKCNILARKADHDRGSLCEAHRWRWNPFTFHPGLLWNLKLLNNIVIRRKEAPRNSFWGQNHTPYLTGVPSPIANMHATNNLIRKTLVQLWGKHMKKCFPIWSYRLLT